MRLAHRLPGKFKSVMFDGCVSYFTNWNQPFLRLIKGLLQNDGTFYFPLTIPYMTFIPDLQQGYDCRNQPLFQDGLEKAKSKFLALNGVESGKTELENLSHFSYCIIIPHINTGHCNYCKFCQSNKVQMDNFKDEVKKEVILHRVGHIKKALQGLFEEVTYVEKFTNYPEIFNHGGPIEAHVKKFMGFVAKNPKV